jgi:hypothetical protein
VVRKAKGEWDRRYRAAASGWNNNGEKVENAELTFSDTSPATKFKKENYEKEKH